ncbi:MAG: hypothetical protein K8F52_06335 [Candidatus Scalindua rubra]|uniref:PIN domain-containing protein n=1 Tax=Candidatus Scalindua brodae TaxID=237368 RepID=A0A0B0EFL7_9BACT|nr:MAG: hypothetical protein SCABRO_02887 [Candidatus Scalindua brodae]MBZ0108267.1 hypothetical protein [Candidatus Scalindua rubra]
MRVTIKGLVTIPRHIREKLGTRLSPLPDLFIGVHAAVGKLELITRDKPRYKSYFPTVKLISP